MSAKTPYGGSAKRAQPIRTPDMLQARAAQAHPNKRHDATVHMQKQTHAHATSGQQIEHATDSGSIKGRPCATAGNRRPLSALRSCCSISPVRSSSRRCSRQAARRLAVHWVVLLMRLHLLGEPAVEQLPLDRGPHASKNASRAPPAPWIGVAIFQHAQQHSN